ncbi:hypothetical protein [Desulfofalx alkaliphila]|uniref:hypothetical protein n=1 Tax=Desulfofalx alkaliphila TaxID=105483 RepID=UPI0004E21BCE|nr:hypothetical protein [Desulfofalx alkaliphila]
MYAIPWYVVLFQSIPEAILVILLGFKLYNLNISIKHIIIISSISCMFGFFIRMLPIPFGIHTFSFVLISAVLVSSITNIKFWHSLICIMTGVIIEGVLQSLMLPVILGIINVSFNELSLYPALIILAFIPLCIVMLGIYMLVNKCGFVIYDLSIHHEV